MEQQRSLFLIPDNIVIFVLEPCISAVCARVCPRKKKKELLTYLVMNSMIFTVDSVK